MLDTIYNIDMSPKKQESKNPEWAKWIKARYDEWRNGKYGNASSIAEFARQFGTGHQVVIGWMDGSVPKLNKYVDALIAAYPDDPEIYDLLGVKKLDDPYSGLPSEVANRLRSANNEISAILNERGILQNSPEHTRLAREIFARYGFDVKEIKISHND